MTFVGWALLGLIAGWIASRAVNKSGMGCLPDIALGLVGAMVGGFIFTAIGGSPVNGFNLYSMLVAIVGAIVVLAIYHTVIKR